jgi:hypothetical protein
MFLSTGMGKMLIGDRPMYALLGWIRRVEPDSSAMSSFEKSCARQLVAH